MKLLQHRAPIDLSMGGLRIYSDERFPIGDSLRLDVFLPDSMPVTFTAEVVWISELPADAPAKFDVGLKFTEVDPTGMRLLAKVLGPSEQDPS
jgi:Tfp pilus assembly protein PilZ